MKIFLSVLILSLQLSFADSNLTKKVEETLQELIAPKDTQKDDKSILVIKEAIKKQKEVNREKEKLEQKKLLEKLEKDKKEKAEKEKAEKEALEKHIKELEERKTLIDEELKKDNIWANQYQPYETYQKLMLRHKEIKDEITDYKERLTLSEVEKLEFKRLKEEYKIIEGKLSQLQEYKENPFAELLAPNKLDDEPSIKNPLDIITAMSYKKHLKSLKEENEERYKSLNDAVDKLREKSILLQELVLLTKGHRYNEELLSTKRKLKDFSGTLEIFKTSVKTFKQKVSQINLNIDENIDKEIKKSIVTGSIILFLLLLFLFIKYLLTKYMSDNDMFYGINKVVNLLFIIIVFIILLFSYLENVDNLMTIVSFASAGIAIALKDWFMSVLGWFVIIVSGSIHVGDRVKFVKDGKEYVGDIVDISVLRMTLHEDVTFTSVYTNRRTGRIIFIPNNYIFTDVIANYSHAGLKTVWDGVDIYLTFDSNISKAQHIAKEVTRKYSKGYTDMTRKQLNKLRSKYSMRNTAVEPRIFGFVDTYGVRLSSWYLTNSYATLTLRSTISMEILSRLQKEDDISLALPSQSLYMDKSAPRPLLEDGEEPTVNHKAN